MTARNGSLAVLTTHLAVGKPDERGTIAEAAVTTASGKYLRTTMISNVRCLESEPRQDGRIRRGDHSHPEVENFVVASGGGVLCTAHMDTPGDVYETTFTVGEQITIPAGIVHTFLCDPGTVLIAITDWAFGPGTTVPCRLDV